MKAFLTFLLWCVVLVALGIFSWGLALYLAWPLWGGLTFFFGIIGLYFGIRLARRLWLISRSRVKLAASEKAGRAQHADTSGHLNDITLKWKEAIRTLRESSLRRFGNPVYALPWFMVVGEPGAGKTSAITRSRLASLNKSVSQFDPITTTLNCDWWFFNRAVVIDTAGRYVSPSGTPEDQAEWERMLELLAKYRSREGLNGLVLAIDAHDLLNPSDDTLERRGHVIRERIDQLIRLFDKRFPIFILVTQCDSVFGFDAWANALPPEALSQAMGYTGPLEQGDEAESRFLTNAFDHIGNRLRSIRLDMGVKGVDLNPELLLFPSELDRLRPGLQRFLTAGMGNNPYLEQPMLRGIFLSSACQNGATEPNALSHLIKTTRTTTPAEKGLFLHDFFERVLPADRWNTLPTIIVDRWRQATRNLAAIVWVSLFATALVFLLVSFYQTRGSLREIESRYPSLALTENGKPEDLIYTLYKALNLTDFILEREKAWQTRWLAFSPEITRLEQDIKDEYVKGYQRFLATNNYNDLFPKILARETGSPLYASTILGMVRNINVSQARINGADYDQLLAMPQFPAEIAHELQPGLPPEIVNSTHRMIVAYKAWSKPDDPVLRANMERDRETLARIVMQSPHLEWLLPWANQLPSLKPVTLREFWLPGSQGKNEGMIEPSLTRQGEHVLNSFLQELGQAFNFSPEFQIKRGAFEAWYQAERINTWKSFAWSFNNGEQLLANEPAWRDMLTRIDTSSSPYYRFFERLKDEFSGLRSDQLPNWLLFARDFSAMRRVAASQNTFDKAGAVAGTINTVGERIIRQTVDQRAFTSGDTIQSTIKGVQAYGDFMRSFDSAASEALAGDGQAYQLASDYFAISSNPEVKTSVLQNTQDALDVFRKTSGYNSPDDQVIWQLVGGPLQLLTRYSLEQASCSVQKEWERSVLWKTQMAVSPREINDQLFGDKGSVWAFADGPAKPFVQQKSTGFSAVRKQDYTFPFSTGFIPFLNTSVDTRVEAVVKSQLAEASMGKSANLLISARPIGVNPGAKAKPYSVNLSIQCAQEELTLDNFNMETTTSFNWSPDQCGDVTLQIRIDNMLLTRRYPGPMGMARFVGEFIDGERIFTPDDFPQARERLDELNVQTLHVRYDFVGQEALLNMADHLDYLAETSTPSLSATPSRLQVKIPERVGQCWTEGIPDQPVTPMPLYIRQRAKQIIEAPPPPPEPAWVSSVAPAPEPPPQPERTHRVKDGETLYSLARRYGTTIEALQKLNHLKNTDLIVTGHILKIPPAQ